MESTGESTIRTQVSLDPQEYDFAKAEAKALGISVAEFVRRAIRAALPATGPATSTDPWMQYAGFVETGNPTFSQTVDELVYGQKD